MFVISSDFDVPPFNLPSLGSNNSFGDFVDNVERGVLKKLLGMIFYNQLVAGMVDTWLSTTTYGNGDTVAVGNDVWTSLQSSNLNQPVQEGAWWTLTREDDIWLTLINGAEYEYNNVTYEWVGMKKMLVPYVWYRWVKDTQYGYQSDIGEVQPDIENGQVINPGVRLSTAYNLFSKIAGGKYCRENTMYGFLQANRDDYEDFTYTPQGRINTFNL